MTAAVADAPADNWVDRRAPAFLRPYLRLSRADRPIGGWLLLWPCWWSASLAAIAQGRALPDLLQLGLFLIGAFAMRGAGCTYNDIVDRDIDGGVERTRSRPLPSGQLGLLGALCWLVLQCLIGLAVLLQFNFFTILLGLGSLLVVAAYPFMKRVTSWPQAVLGFAFSWGALMGWAGAFGHIGLPAILLYAGTVLWVIGYDTIYACQDKEDDALLGVRSTALLFGDHARMAVAAFYLGSVALMTLALACADASLFAFMGLGVFTVHLAIQLMRLDTDDASRCLAVFRSNRDAGAILFAGLIVESVVRWL